eukprot:g40462.t1
MAQGSGFGPLIAVDGNLGCLFFVFYVFQAEIEDGAEGNCVELYLRALISAVSDNDETVRKQVEWSLRKLGCQRPRQLLRYCCTWLLAGQGQRVLDSGLRTSVLRGAGLIASEGAERAGTPLAQEVMAVAVAELRPSVRRRPQEAESAAGELLASLGRAYPAEALGLVLGSLVTDGPPRLSLLKALASLVRTNARGCTPGLPPILGALLRALDLEKDGDQVQALISTIGLLHRSVTEYLGSPGGQTSEPGLGREAFSGHARTFYRDHLSRRLPGKDPNLRAAVLEALADTLPLLPLNQGLAEELPGLVTRLLSLYSRPPRGSLVTRCLLSALGPAGGGSCPGLRAQAHQLMEAVWGQLGVVGPFPDEPGHRALLLDCLGLMARLWPQPAARFLLRLPPPPTAPSPGGQGARLRPEAYLEALAQLVDGVPLSEVEAEGGGGGGGGQVLAVVVQTILTCHPYPAPGAGPGLEGAALAAVGSLARRGYLSLPGGEALVEFVVSLCARPGEEVRSWGAAEGRDVPGRAGAGPLLEWLALVEGSENILWETLLRCVLVDAYAQALPAVCRCLERLALREPGRPGLRDGAQHGLPSPEGLLIRLLAVSSLPGGCAPDALRLLLALGPSLPTAARGVCQAEIPGILLVLPGAWAGGRGRGRRRWEERVWLLFLSASGNDEAWAERMGQEAMRQAGRMACGPWERGFLLRGAGGLLKQTGSRELVRARLQEMLGAVRYQRAPEVEGLARGIGLCAARHTDEALEELARFAGSLLGQGSGGRGREEEAVRSGIILCYGWVAQGAPVQRLLPGLDAELLRPLLLLYQAGEPPGLGGKAQGLGTGLRLARALVWVLHLALGNGQQVCSPCPSKGELLCCLQELLGAQPLGGCASSPLRRHALKACSLLIQLDPALGRDSTFQLVRRCVGSVIGLRLSEWPAGSEEEGWEEDEGEEEEEEECEALLPDLTGQTFRALRGLLEQALLQDLTWEGLGLLLRALEGWTLSVEARERERSLELMAKLLALYRERAGCQVRDGCPTGYRPEALLGRLLPRCLDPSGPVRLQALDCLLELSHLLGPGPMVAISLQRLGELWEKAGGPSRLGLCSELAKSLCQAVQGLGLSPLLAALCQGLRDPHPEGAGACAAVLHAIVCERGPELREKGDPGLTLLLRELWAHLRESRHLHIQLVALRSLALLARYHPEPALHFLLDCSHEPRPGEGRRLWAAMGWCPGLALRLTELLLERLRTGLAQEEAEEVQEEEERKRRKEAEALGHLLPHPGLGPSLPTIYPSSFAILLLLCSRQALGLALGKASPSERAVSLLRVLLTRGDRPEVASLMEERGGWELLRSPGSYQRGISLLAEAMARGASPHLPAILESLSSALDACRRGGVGPGRGGSPTMATVAAFFSQAAQYHPALGLGHADLLLSGLLHCLLDPSLSTRLLVLRGFGNVAAAPSPTPGETVGPTRRRRYTTKLLAALLSGMEGAGEAGQGREEEAQVLLEGLRALSKVLAQSEGDGEGQGTPGDILVNLCLGIRPLFEAQSATVRASALCVFGALSRFAVGSRRPVYVEQLRSVLVALLVYVNDSSLEVAQASGLLLASVRPLLGWDGLQMELPLKDGAHGYQAFLSQLSRSGLHQGPGYTKTYLSSGLRFCSHPRPQLRANAIAITGQLLRNMPKDSRHPLGDDEQL